MTNLYTCDNCHYTFQSEDAPEQVLRDRCPDCGKFEVRAATEDEESEYYKIQDELTAECR